MQAVVLCPSLPEIAISETESRPVVSFQLAWFSNHGIKEVILIGPSTQVLGDGSDLGMVIHHAENADKAIPFLHGSFLVTESDCFVPADCEDSWREFRITPEPIIHVKLSNEEISKPGLLVMMRDAFVEAVRLGNAGSLHALADSRFPVRTYSIAEKMYEALTAEGRQSLTEYLRSSHK